MISRISIGPEAPRWLRELVRYLPLKNLLFLSGNIHDLVTYPVNEYDDRPDVKWVESDLTEFLRRFLKQQRYEVIGFLNPIEGLAFSDLKTMEPVYRGLQTAKPDTPSGSGKKERESQGYKKDGPEYLNHELDRIRAALKNTEIPCAFVMTLASRLVGSPGSLAEAENNNLFTRILKASLEGGEVFKEGNRWNNVIILVCDKLNDLPAFLYLINPRARSIYIDKPDTTDRERFMKSTYPNFFGAAEDSRELPKEWVTSFAALTEGLTNYEMSSLVRLSINEQIPIQIGGVLQIQKICERYKYGITESEWDKIKQRLQQAEIELNQRVKGQPKAVDRVLDIIKRASIGLAAGTRQKSTRPRGVLFFAGPTGVGKTELAKGLAKVVFGHEDSLIRFDMSEYSAQHADQKLLGAPPGYVGYEEGGQLTNAVKERPFSVLLFDEIEKAHGSIFDKFLQILDDGRLTDGKGGTVYFSESIIIFTSNLGTVSASIKEGSNQREDKLLRTLLRALSRAENSSIEELEREQDVPSRALPEMEYETMEEKIKKAIRDHFNLKLGRPEIFNRFGENFVVFDFIRPPFDKEILNQQTDYLVKACKAEKEIVLVVSQTVRDKLLSLAQVAEKRNHHGGRGIRNMVDRALVDPLSRLLFDDDIKAGAKVKLLDLVDHGEKTPRRFELTVEVDRA